MYTTINEYKLNENNDVRFMALNIPNESEWVFENDRYGIKSYESIFWINEKDLDLFKSNVGKEVRFRYVPSERVIMMPDISIQKY